jgi:threonine/homoserine efflux transporter RhtA
MKTALRLPAVLSLATLIFVGCHELGHVDGLGTMAGLAAATWWVKWITSIHERAKSRSARTRGACRSSTTTTKLKSFTVSAIIPSPTWNAGITSPRKLNKTATQHLYR